MMTKRTGWADTLLAIVGLTAAIAFIALGWTMLSDQIIGYLNGIWEALR